MAKQYGFYMDTERCIKCWACEVACKQWNGIEAGTIARRAITKRGEDGIVVVDKEKCIGCHYCFFACPFGVPQYTDEGMDKCDCCIGNGVEPGDMPHCVATCPTQALQFGTMDELAEKVGDKKARQMAADAKPSVVVS